MRITAVEVRTAPFTRNTWLDQSRVSTPLSPFPRFAERRSSWRGPGADLVSVWVRTDTDAVFGLGQSRGGAVTAALVTEHLAPLLRGQDGTAVALRTEELRRAVAPYAAGGIGSMGVAAVEQALWDLAARAAGVPLYALLGGHGGAVPSYLTCADPATVADAVAGTDAPVVKIPMPYGPVDGAAGLAANVELVARTQEAVPAGTGVAVDCFLSWDETYTLRFARAAASYGLDWIEEPLPAEDYDGYRRLRSALGPVRLAAGEHVFGLEAGLRFLAGECVDVVQYDVTWCGGVRTAMVLGEVAAARGVLFAPHAAGNQPWATHLLTALGPGVLAEVLTGTGAPDRYPARPGDGPGVGLTPADLGFSWSG